MSKAPGTNDTKTAAHGARFSPRRWLLYIVVLGVGAIAGFFTVEIATGQRALPGDPTRPAASSPAVIAAQADEHARPASLVGGALETLLVHEQPKAVPDFEFIDNDGQKRTLNDWRGKLLLVNIWATWCPPCVEEMPALDRLQAAVGTADFAVLPISIDRGGLDQPRAFLKKIEADNLPVLLDETARLNFTLQALGLPATLLIDREGREIARMIGPAEWDAPEAIAFIRAATAQ
jgi:thiol-disulfide isomerase/thioredoxin